MKRYLVLMAVAFIGWGNPASAVNLDEEPRREDLARVEYLIGMLVSRNPAPVVKGNVRLGDDQTLVFPKDYDKSLQVPVYLAAQQLLAEGETALGPLLTHVEDGRYSFSVNHSNTDYNVSVSGACEMIANRIILAFDPELHFITRSQGRAYPSEKPRLPLAKWWEANKRRGLRAVQIEAIDAMISYMKAVDSETALPTHADAEPLPIGEFNHLREENLRILTSIRHTIMERGQPYRPKSLDDGQRCLYGLPWTRRHHNL